MIPTSALAVFAAAPSKTPFYIAGGALAVWAVALAAFGITRPGFPGSKGGRRGVIGASALLVLAAMGRPSRPRGRREHGGAEATWSRFELVADPGGATSYDQAAGPSRPDGDDRPDQRLDAGPQRRGRAGRAASWGELRHIKGGETELRVDLEPGEYEFYCTVTGHRAAGWRAR